MLAHAVLASLCAGLVSASVICSDGTVCPDKNTCCLTKKGYGCCILPSAVCCPDLLHCCPHGYHCSDGDGTHSCVKDGLPWFRLPWHKNTPAKEPETTALQLSLSKSDNTAPRKESAILEKQSSAAVVHCDNYFVCPDGTTCCRSPYGTWSCCSFSLGQCCIDGIHCCPYGFHCDLTTFRCLRGSLSIAASPQLPALRSDYQDLCCLTEAGCCQAGFHCDRELRACVSDVVAPVVWTTLTEDRGDGGVALRGVIRCDGHFYCPADNSCCRTPTGEWGCCPYQLGQCCMDGRHCCEYHWTCDPTSMSCNKGENYIPSATIGQIQEI
ncbi:hypothetical protein ACEWY4_023827 [Coilia grayii]|uniref:Granulins domain-containing protein n=1 Tax=Coilia grayii TaxID=363190 RepID=A0ABD1IZI2_9TELE